MKKTERIAALEAQLTKALTDLAVLQTRVAILENEGRKWVTPAPLLHPPTYTPAAPYFRPWEVTCKAAQ